MFPVSRLRAPRITWPSSQNVARARRVLAADGIIAYPTESCFGLGCNPRSPGAIRRLCLLKRRSRGKGLILIAADVAQIAPFVEPGALQDLGRFKGFWPGPYTFLVPASRKVHPWLRGRHRQIAVRITRHPLAAGLCQALGTALVSTSANLSGKVSLKTAADCRQSFGGRLFVVPGLTGFARKPSTIIDAASGKILRG
jgi:L-threonylcarbamoyladenylate synthase